jgi:hypothetical protein
VLRVWCLSSRRQPHEKVMPPDFDARCPYPRDGNRIGGAEAATAAATSSADRLALTAKSRHGPSLRSQGLKA